MKYIALLVSIAGLAACQQPQPPEQIAAVLDRQAIDAGAGGVE